PIQTIERQLAQITYQRQTTTVPAHLTPADAHADDNVMLVRNRKSRIYVMRKFFSYPITLSADTLSKLGLWKTLKIGLSYLRALMFSIKPETNLIEQFLYPKYGPGQMWEEVAELVKRNGGEILMHWSVDEVRHDGAGQVRSVLAHNTQTGETREFGGDYFFSTMPVKELVAD